MHSKHYTADAIYFVNVTIWVLNFLVSIQKTSNDINKSPIFQTDAKKYGTARLKLKLLLHQMLGNNVCQCSYGVLY
jgi:hypothetical protein